MSSQKRLCKECGESFQPRQYQSSFCSTPCRTAFNRRRRDRGAELYDIVMESMYGSKAENRTEAKALTSALADAYRSSDDQLRKGRDSWQTFTIARINIPMAYGKQGDKR